MKKLLQSLFILLFVAVSAMAQERTITGTVTSSEDKLPIPGVSVKIKGASGGTQTGPNGKFAISTSSTSVQLEFSYLGFVTKTVSVNSGVVNVSLDSDSKTLSDVVVTGYQTVKKSDLTSSIVSVSGKEVEDKPIGSFTQLLQGKAAGVQVTGQSGRPGANAFIRMRGTGSLGANGSEPLIIVDGISIPTVAFNMLNPNDIENINFLKDASATAIYGSRGSNGVVVVTTKNGKANNPVLSYSFRYGISNAQDMKNVELMDAAQKLQFEFETGQAPNANLTALINSRIAANQLPANATLYNISGTQRQSLWDQLIAGGNDWKAQFMRKDAKAKTHEITLSGGTDKLTYYFSLNKSDNEGVEQESYWNRTGGRLNVVYQAKDWFKMGTNIGVTHTVENLNRELFNGQALYTASLLLNAYEPAYNPDGSYNYTSLGQNALETAINNPSVSDRIGTFGTFYGEANFLKHLTIRSQMGLTYNTLSTEYYLKPGSYLAQTLGYNQKRDNGNRDFLYDWTNTAIWNQTFNEKHTITALVGTEYIKDKFYSYSLTARGFPSATLETLENAATPFATTTSRSDFALVSYFTSLQYDFNKKYFLSLSGRRDGSSRFGKNVRYANFWAIGGAWDIKKEEFFNFDVINTLKLRGSIGTSGNNSGIGNYDALGTYAYNVNYNQTPAASPSTIANPGLTWESNKNWDLGLDFGLLANRIRGSVDYYNRTTNDLLFPVNLSLTTGFASYTGNIGSIVNKGIELSLSGDVIKKNDFVWTLNASYSNNSNKVKSLYTDNVAAAGTGGYGYLKVGEPVFTYYLPTWAGVNPQTGKNEWIDATGKASDVYSSNSTLHTGKSSQIKFFGSFGTQFTYKEFDLGAQFYYSGGNYIYNVVWNVGAAEGESYKNNQFVEALDYWKKPGDVKRYANLADPSQQVTYDSDKYLEKGDYISLRDITLGYTLNSKIATKIHTKSVRLFVQGTNLWLGTKFHGVPEQGQSNSEQTTYTQPGLVTLFSYPQFKSFQFGVNVKF